MRNVLVTGSSGYIGKSIIKIGLKDCVLFEGGRHNLNLFDVKSLSEIIKSYNIDSIIHCAIEGGSRLKNDSAENFYHNLLMFETIRNCRHLVKKVVNIGSGAEFDRSKHIYNAPESALFKSYPVDYYGLAKNIIAKRAYSRAGFSNIRVFGCFDENEKDTRFIKTCINKCLVGSDIYVDDKWMDFIYLPDLLKIIEYALDQNTLDINASYLYKYKLSEIATWLKIEMSVPTTNIFVTNKENFDYCGSGEKLNDLNLPLIGLWEGIKNTIRKIKS